VVIPEEAELVIPTLRSQTWPKVWLLTYSAPVTRAMSKFNTLRYLTIPDMPKDTVLPGWLVIEVGILAGRLYFEWAEYQDILEWLGLTRDKKSPAGLVIRQPRKFLIEWLTHCRQTHDVSHTPMGYICNKKPLKESHSFFQSADGGQAAGHAPVGATADGQLSHNPESSPADSESSDEELPWDAVDEDGSNGSESMDLGMGDDSEEESKEGEIM
jgi:hypothetical protein